MTSATFPRRCARIAALTSVMTVALALTAGCVGDSGGSGNADKDSRRTASTAPTGSTDTGAASGDRAGGAGELEGNWLATKDGKAVALVVTGGEAGLFSTGGSVCSGTAGVAPGKRKIALRCTDGNKDRAEGTVDSVDSTTLKVTWEGFGEETYTRSEGGNLPSGLPTASPGS